MHLLSAKGLITLSDVCGLWLRFQCMFDPWPKIDLAVALAARFITPSSILTSLGDAILAERASGDRYIRGLQVAPTR
jgi:hypothetical protein